MHIDHLSDDDYDRLARFVSGEASDVERAATAKWVDADPSRQEALAELERSWRLTAADESWDVDAAWGKIAAGIAADVSPHVASPTRDATVVSIDERRRQRTSTTWFLRAAAALVLVAGGAAVVMRTRGGESTSSAVELAATSVTTKAGEHRTVRLPDGSTVALGVSSTLRTRPGFGNGAREVELEGEALFTVGHDASNPFRVHAGQTVVEDLGTEFAVRSYADDDGVALRVAVASGSVAVRRGTSADTAVMLSPRDVATVRSAGEIAVARDVDVTPFTAFAAGRLMFVDAAFSDVIRDLERWYGVKVSVTDDEILDRHLTGTFEREALAEVLRIISLALDVRFERNGNEVRFMPKAATTFTPHRTAALLARAGA